MNNYPGFSLKNECESYLISRGWFKLVDRGSAYVYYKHNRQMSRPAVDFNIRGEINYLIEAGYYGKRVRLKSLDHLKKLLGDRYLEIMI